MGKVTIIDVARLAGVSTATVSRAMHAPHVVRPATLERVKQVMQECGYVYNATAGDFSRRKSTVVGVLLLTSSNKVAQSLRAAQEVATAQQFPLIVSTSGFDPDMEREHLQQFLQRGVAGVLVIGHLSDNVAALRELPARGIPCVYLWDVLPGTSESYVGFDNFQGSYDMVNHLIRLGHKRIGFLCGFNTGVERIVRRYEGYKKALEANGLPFDERFVRSATSTYARGKSAMLELLALPDPPRCVCCASDVIALGAMSAVYEAGYSVPKDFTIVGFDNSEFSAYTWPGLTTVHVPGERMGRLGMQALMQLINGEVTEPIQVELSTSLMERGSHCPADMMNTW